MPRVDATTVGFNAAPTFTVSRSSVPISFGGGISCIDTFGVMTMEYDDGVSEFCGPAGDVRRCQPLVLSP